MTTSKSLRHRAHRLPIRLLTKFEGGFKGNFFIENLSSGGLFIETERPLKEGSTITVEFSLPHNKKKFMLDAIVSWMNDKNTEEKRKGMGIKFLNASESQQKDLEVAVNQYQSIIG